MGARLAEVAGGCAAGRSQELTLLAGGSCAGSTCGSGLGRIPRTAPPPKPGVTFQECWQRLSHLERVSGAAGAPSGAWPGAGGGRHPARISWLLPPPAGVAPRVGLPLGPETERAADVMWLSSWEECKTSGPAAWPPLAERGN